MTKPAIVDSNDIIEASSTSFLIQGTADPGVTFQQTSGNWIYNQANSDTIFMEEDVNTTIDDQAQGTHISLDSKSVLTTVMDFQDDSTGVIDFTSESFTSMAAISAALQVVPGVGTILNQQFQGPAVMEFKGDYNVSISQFHMAPPLNLITPLSPDGAEVYRLYTAAFNRTPDAGGQAFWTAQLDGGETLNAVAQGFVSSPEFQSDYGKLSVSDFVSDLYQNILHRAGDPGGVQFWTNELSSGAMTQASVLIGFSDSAENRALTAVATGT